MPDFRQRSREPELMDGDEVSQEEFAACIRDLATVNSVTLGRRPTLDFVRRALRATPDGMLTVLDVGFGAGDMLRAIRRQTGPCARLIGIDYKVNITGIVMPSTDGALKSTAIMQLQTLNPTPVIRALRKIGYEVGWPSLELDQTAPDADEFLNTPITFPPRVTVER